jgi:adenylate cyclase
MGLLLTRLLFTVVAIGLAWAAWQNPVEPFSGVAARLNDLKFQHNPAQPDSGVVFLNVDEAAVRRFGRWPWDRSIIAEQLAKLDQASVVVLDMVFSEPTTEEADLAMEDTLYALGNVVGGLFFRASGRVRTSQEALDTLALSALERVSGAEEIAQFPGSPFVDHNVPGMLEAAALNATFSIIPDPDLILRHYTLAFQHEGFLIPTLGVQALRFHKKQDLAFVNDDDGSRLELAGKPLPVLPDGSVRINFYREEHYRSVSFAELAEGTATPEDFAGKIVIFGISEAGVTDIVPTPNGLLPGPLLHLTFVSNYLADHFVVEDPMLAKGGIVFLALLPLLASIVLGNVFLRVALVAASGFGVYHFSIEAYREAFIFIDIFYPLAALGLCLGFQESLSFFLHDRRIRQMRRSYLGGSKEGAAPSAEMLSLRGKTHPAVLLHCFLNPTYKKAENSGADFHLLNRFLQSCNDILLGHGAIIDAMGPDGWKAYLGLPLKECGGLANATACVLDLQALWQASLEEHVADHPNPFLETEYAALNPRLIAHYAPLQVDLVGPEHSQRISFCGPLCQTVANMRTSGWMRPGGIVVSEELLAETGRTFAQKNLLRLPGFVEKPWEFPARAWEKGRWCELLPPGKVAAGLRKRYTHAFEALASGEPEEGLGALRDCTNFYFDPLAARFLSHVLSEQLMPTTTDKPTE